MEEKNASTVCALCGLVAEGTPVTWVCAVESGGRCYLCDTCSRDNIRAIESRLSPLSEKRS